MEEIGTRRRRRRRWLRRTKIGFRQRVAPPRRNRSYGQRLPGERDISAAATARPVSGQSFLRRTCLTRHRYGWRAARHGRAGSPSFCRGLTKTNAVVPSPHESPFIGASTRWLHAAAAQLRRAPPPVRQHMGPDLGSTARITPPHVEAVADHRRRHSTPAASRPIGAPAHQS